MEDTNFKNEDFQMSMGPMNGPDAKHPATIIATCYLLNTPLPWRAKCKNQPSKYIKKGTFDGKLSTITRLLGDNMPEIKKRTLRRAFRAFKRKYKTQKNISYNKANLTVYFCDWLLFARNRGFSHNCYFDYELYNKEPDIRDTFLNEGYRTRVCRACRKKGYAKVFLNKARFNKTFKKFVKRDWIDASTCSFEEFKTFVEKHDRFFAKPVEGTGGAGARIIECDSDTIENLYAACKTENLIVEEIIEQHKALAEYNTSTLNTVRINTLLCADGVARITLAVARFGRSGNVVDNFHSGGVGAIVDIESGQIISEAISRAHIRSTYHLDSRKKILGSYYPEWEKIKEAVCEAAAIIPEVRHVGWDICVTKEGEVEFVEGNGRPNFDVLQSPDQLGRRFRYEPYLPALEELANIKPTSPLVPLVIDTKGLELTPIPYYHRKIKRKIKRKISSFIKKHKKG